MGDGPLAHFKSPSLFWARNIPAIFTENMDLQVQNLFGYKTGLSLDDPKNLNQFMIRVFPSETIPKIKISGIVLEGEKSSKLYVQ